MLWKPEIQAGCRRRVDCFSIFYYNRGRFWGAWRNLSHGNNGFLWLCDTAGRAWPSAAATTTNANHFLKSLAQSGFASVQTTKRPLGKGRPSAVYRLEL